MIPKTKRFEEKQTDSKRRFGHYQQANIYCGRSKRRTRKKAEEYLKKTTAENFTNFMKCMYINIQEA